MTEPRKLSRSTFIAGGAAAAAAGLPFAQDAWAGGSAIPGAEAALELVFKVDHVGTRVTSFGYATGIAGIPSASLFSSAAEQSERTAHFTVLSLGVVVSRSVLEAVRVIGVEGTVQLFYRASPGASFDDPTSFGEGTLVAAYNASLQSIVTVTAPRRGIENLGGLLVQTRSTRFPYGKVGRRGLRLKLSATGTGRLLDPKAPHAVLVLAGSAVTAS